MTPFLREWFLANLLQSAIGMIWLRGVAGIFGTLPPLLRIRIQSWLLVLPVLLPLARFFGVPPFPDALRIFRISLWSEMLAPWDWILLLICGGTGLIFILQEFLPLLRRLQYSIQSSEEIPETFRTAWRQILHLADRTGLPRVRGRPVQLCFLADAEPNAALIGILEPRLILTRGLHGKLASDELQSTLAHELAHHHYGGNLRMSLLWIFRALQAFNPFALILFRDTVLALEMACDRFAARLTGSTDSLVRALEKTAHEEVPGARRDELARRADEQVLRLRVDALNHPDDSNFHFGIPAPLNLLFWLATALLFWGIQ